MFNERGVEYVGLRELAATLNIRVSNITYYFPTKDDLVNQLSLELNELNSKVVVENDQITLTLFLEMLNSVFQNHVKYRCLLLSFVHLMDQNKVMSVRYQKTQDNRNATLKSNLDALAQVGLSERKGRKRNKIFSISYCTYRQVLDFRSRSIIPSFEHSRADQSLLIDDRQAIVAVFIG